MEFSNICNVGFAMNPKKMRKSSSDAIHLTTMSSSAYSNTNDSKSEWKGTNSLLIKLKLQHFKTLIPIVIKYYL
jgi:hypothetical protein